ncbi:pyruvate kinase [Pullulanibacillus sp. KACC 23026]|uniref:pyruvate kinase n=1 Tax=Pullulanibacillus sp. KACC 23026 TaxID=3028315 RepID=UPI0023B110AD|nr:pyruvate kinase [Pullulanibacillus sp. KACC 23026]WEG13902.1 pyruvate kinase [Pullulanibacillus sp. KACC 23026]
MRKTKIVCTIGPASETVEKLEQLMNAGMNVARLNFSHGDHEEHGNRIKNIRIAAEKNGKTIGILLDTKGPEIRTGDMATDKVHLEKGQKLVISMEPVKGTAERISVTYTELASDVHPGSTILLDDGLIGLKVVSATSNEIVTEVLNTGDLKSKKGVNVPGVSVNLPGITKKDAEDILFGIEQGIDFIAASFVRRASDVLEIRELLEKNGGEHIMIIPKIENQEGVENIDEILEVSDGLMVARGDLGVEIPAEEVPLVQKMLIKKCNKLGKPVITATQMLDSMQRNPRPTRAEASDVANAIFDGTDAIMLSGETAAGDYPVEAVETMHRIALRTEQSLDYQQMLSVRSKTNTSITDSIGQAVAHTALNLNVSSIITSTYSGHSAFVVAKYRPKANIVAVTSTEKALRRLSLVWGVYPQLGKLAETTDEMLDSSVDAAVESGYVKHGDLVVITAGVPVGEVGTTNLLKIHVVGQVLAKGQGIGRKSASGPVYVTNDPADAVANMPDGAVLVTASTDREFTPAMERAAAVITEEGGLTSHAAVVGINLDIPVIVGVSDAVNLLRSVESVTIDAERGNIYNGHAKVL